MDPWIQIYSVYQNVTDPQHWFKRLVTTSTYHFSSLFTLGISPPPFAGGPGDTKEKSFNGWLGCYTIFTGRSKRGGGLGLIFLEHVKSVL
jgi:hypothetical protein